MHPTQPQTIWTAGVDGGVWKSVDGGANWVPLSDFMASVVVSCLALDPNNPDVLYAGTGEGFYNIDAMRGFGIFRSTDGGNNWAQLVNTQGDSFRWINRLAFSPNGQVLLVATHSGMFRSVRNSNFETFTPLTEPVNGESLDVQFSPSDSAHCIASRREGKAFYSEDGGQSWHPAAGIPIVQATQGIEGRVELAYARASQQVVYAVLDNNKGEVYRSLDGGKTYVLRSSPAHLGYPDPTIPSQGWYGNAVWAGDPINPDLVVIGGIDLHRSTDGGTVFNQISDWNNAPTSPHSDHHAIVSHATYDGTANKAVFCCNDGGVYAAQDITVASQASGWRQLNNGLIITQFYGGAGNPTSKQIVVGAQDNDTMVYTPTSTGAQWTKILGGDGGFCAANPSSPVFFGEYITLLIGRSANGAAAVDIYQGIDDAGSEASLFIAPFILDPNDPNVMYAGGSYLWRSLNVNVTPPSWTKVKNPLATMVGADAYPVRISAIGMARGHSSVIWVGHEIFTLSASQQSGAIFLTTNGNAEQPTWNRVDNGQLPRRHCTRIVVDPADPARRAYALFGGYNTDNLWLTTNGGQNWAKVNGSAAADKLPAVPFYDLTFHPDDARTLILANEAGLFLSADGGAHWDVGNKGPTNCAVFQMFWMGRNLVAVTHGRGLYQFDLPPHAAIVNGLTTPRVAPTAKSPAQ